MGRKPGLDGHSHVLHAAANLFYSRGIEDVSVDDVANAAGLTKRALYYHFPNKRALVIGYLSAADQPALALLRGLAQVKSGERRHPFEQILLGLKKWLQTDRFHGCAFLRAVRSLPADEQIRQLASQHKENTLDWLSGIAAEHGANDPPGLARRFRLILDAVLTTGHLYEADALIGTAQELLHTALKHECAPTSPGHGAPDCST